MHGFPTHAKNDNVTFWSGLRLETSGILFENNTDSTTLPAREPCTAVSCRPIRCGTGGAGPWALSSPATRVRP